MEYMWPLIVLGIIAILVLAILKLIAVAARWQVLATAFPVSFAPCVLARFSRAISHVGAVTFKKSGCGSVAITEQGLLVSIANPFMGDLMIPFASIKSIRTLRLFGRTTVTIYVNRPVPLTLRLPAEALPYLRGKVSNEVFQQEEDIASLGDVFAMDMKSMKKSQPTSPGVVATRAAPEK